MLASDVGEVFLVVASVSGNPLVDVAGAYFPAWLASMLVALPVAWLAGVLAGKAGLGGVMRPAPLMWPGVFIAVTCGVWLLFFAAR